MKKRSIFRKADRFRNRRHLRLDAGNKIYSKDFSIIEDDRDSFSLIRTLARKAGNQAAAEARAHGLETAYVRGNKLVKVSAKGEAVALAQRSDRTYFFVKYKPDTVLHAVRK